MTASFGRPPEAISRDMLGSQRTWIYRRYRHEGTRHIFHARPAGGWACVRPLGLMFLPEGSKEAGVRHVCRSVSTSCSPGLVGVTSGSVTYEMMEPMNWGARRRPDGPYLRKSITLTVAANPDKTSDSPECEAPSFAGGGKKW